MKTIGLLGGLPWEETVLYYTKLNRYYERFQNEKSLKSLIYSFDFIEMEKLRNRHKWETISKEMIYQAEQLKKAGSDLLVITSDLYQKVCSEIQFNTRLPLINKVEAVGEVLVDQKITKVLFLGTRSAMLDDYYEKILKTYGIEVVTPVLIHINDIERLVGNLTEENYLKLIAIIESYAFRGVSGLLIGNDQLCDIIKEEDLSVSVFSAIDIHIEKIIKVLNEYS